MSLLARLAVALVIAVAFATWLAPSSTEQPPREEPKAIRIAAIALPEELPAAPDQEPAPARRPDPPPRPPTDPPSQPAEKHEVVPSATDLARGEALLEAGAFPRMRASYARIGFERYRDALLALGGSFYLYDRERREILAGVDPRTESVFPAASSPGLSRWPRDVTRHLKGALEVGRSRYGSRATRVILLPPAGLDAALLGALESRLRRLGVDPGSVVRMDVVYELRAGRLHCSVLAVGLRDGGERELDLAIDLSGGTRT